MTWRSFRIVRVVDSSNERSLDEVLRAPGALRRGELFLGRGKLRLDARLSARIECHTGVFLDVLQQSLMRVVCRPIGRARVLHLFDQTRFEQEPLALALPVAVSG